MPMDSEDYENYLNELNNPDLEHSRRTEILQSLRVDYAGVIEDNEKQLKTIDKLTLDNQDLVLSNSKLFRQLGIQDNPVQKKEEEEKAFSETITLEQIEAKIAR